MIINDFTTNFIENIDIVDIEGYHFDDFPSFLLFKKGNYISKPLISIFSVYDILGNISLLKNKEILLDFLKKEKIEEIIFAVPIFTPSFEEFYFQEWKDFICEAIKNLPKTKITFSIYTINQLEFLKKKVLNTLDIIPQINFDQFFYNQSLDPMFFLLNIEDIKIWNDTTYSYYKKEVEKYWFKPGKIETFLKTMGDYSSSDHSKNVNKGIKNKKQINPPLEKESLPFLFFAPKIVYSFSLRIFQFTKHQWIKISALYDPVLLSRNSVEEKEIKDILYKENFNEINAELNLWNISKSLLKHINNKKDIDLKCFYKNNYQYWYTEKEL